MVLSRMRQAVLAGLAAFRGAFVEPQEQAAPARPELGWYRSVDRSTVADTVARNVSPQEMARTLRNAEAGDLTAQFDLFSKFELDGHIFSTMSKRRRAVLGKPLVVESADSTDGRANDAAQLVEYLIGEIKHWRRALFDLTDAIGKGYSVGQLRWVYDGKYHRIAEIERWNQRQFVPVTPKLQAELEDHPPLDSLRLIEATSNPKGEALAPYQWVTHQQYAVSAPLGMAPLFRVVATAYICKHFPLKDWLIFSETYGSPRRVGKYPAHADDAERMAVRQATLAFGRDLAAVLPQGASLELLQAKVASGDLPFPDLIQLANAEISIAIAGQTLTTDAGDRGARSLGEVHERVAADLTEGDCEELAETLTEQIATPLTRFNLGDAPVPTLRFITKEDQDLETRAKRDKIVIGDLGLPAGESYLRETYGIPTPDAGERLVGGGVYEEPA